MAQGNLEESVEAALTSVGLVYFQPRAHYRLGEALLRLGMIDRAVEAFNVAVTQAPGMRVAHQRLARLYEFHLDEPTLAEKHRKMASVG
jgi:lipopolysaccharide biosynthesis regulator YciM